MTRQLSYAQYQQTFQAPMQDVTATADEAVDIRPYVDAIPASELGGYTIRDVAQVYKHPNGQFKHVLIATEDKNVFLAIIIDLATPAVAGHYLLDLAVLYSLNA